MSLKNKRIVIIGGSSGIGFATAIVAHRAGAEVVIASRSLEKLENARNKISSDITIKQVDITDSDSLKKFFAEIGCFDHLQLPASDLKSGSLLGSSVEDARASFESKFWGPYFSARYAYPHINKENGSITFFSGAFSKRPTYPGATTAAAVNGAIEGLVRAMAYELAPLRVNAVSPGLTMTERVTHKYSPEALQKLSADFCQQLMIKRPAAPDEIAQAAIYLMKNTYTTGCTLYVDGGLTLD